MVYHTILKNKEGTISLNAPNPITTMSDTLIEQLKTVLLTKKLTIATAESVTCGHLQTALGSVSGSSAFFQGGITVYNLARKVKLLAVSAEHATSCNCVSQQVTNELAQGACRLFDSDLGLAATGYAEPCPEQDIAIPMAYYAVCHRNGDTLEIVRSGQLTGENLSRTAMQQQTSMAIIQAALHALTH